MSARIDLMTPADWPDVCATYEQGIATGLGTFETNGTIVGRVERCTFASFPVSSVRPANPWE